MVSDADEHGMRSPLGLKTECRTSEVGQGGDKPILQRYSGLPISRLEVVMAVYGEQGLSGEVVELFKGAIRANTTSAYDSAW